MKLIEHSYVFKRILSLSNVLAFLGPRDPLNATLREEYHPVLKQYKTLLNNKRNEYYNNKISELEDTTLNSDKKHFWNCLKSMDDSVKQKVTPEIWEENWLRLFQSLHSNDLLNPDQQNVVNELQKQQGNKMQSTQSK